MADFIAGVLDHSNARPAGITAQVTKTTDLGVVNATMAISARADRFAPLANASVAVFTATDAEGFDDDGKCAATGNPCDWTDTENYTNDSGNYFPMVSVATVDADGNAGGNLENSETWYSWMGSEDNAEFVKGSSGEAMVTLTAMPNALGIRVTSDLAENNTGEEVNLGKDSEVVITAQLVDEVSNSPTIEDANPVANEGVELSITRTRGPITGSPGPGSMKTDADGKVTFTIEGPDDDEDDDTQSRDDVVTFEGDVDGTVAADNESGTITIQWRETVPAVNKANAKTDASYAIIDDDEVSIRVTVNYYDQYGNPAAQNDTTTIAINDPTDDINDNDATNDGVASRLVRVRNNGSVSFRGSVKTTAGAEVTVTVTALSTASAVAVPTADPVLAVEHAHKNDDGKSGNISDIAADNQVIVDADNDRFIIDTGDGTVGTIAGVLYSYNSGDTFIVGNKSVDMDMFEKEIGESGNTVTVVFYSVVDGISIFSVAPTT